MVTDTELDLEMESPLVINNNYKKTRRFTNLEGTRPHRPSARGTTPLKILGLAVLGGVTLPLFLPTIHMLVFYALWGSGETEVDINKCQCNCWDTVFKGPYESGVAKYKHVYFNSTPNTFKMWAITLLFFISLYEVIKHLILLSYKKRVRFRMGLLLLASIHSHYYAWWGHWNYWNDDFYHQWNHQVFFTLTEGISTVCVLSQIDKRRELKPGALILVGTISLFHIGCSMNDQFYSNVLLLRGEFHQVLRDVFLMSTDLVQLVMVWRELKGYCGDRGVGVLLRERRFGILIGGSLMLMFLYVLVFP